MPQNKTLSAITTRAKQLRKKKPNLGWIAAVKQSTKELKSEGKIGGAKPARKKKVAKKSFRQTGTSNLSKDKQRRALPPGKRTVKHKGGKKSVYYERRKNRSDKPGKLWGVGSASMYSVRDQFERDISQTLNLIEAAKRSTLTPIQKRTAIKKLRKHLTNLRDQLKYQNQLINQALK